MKKLFTFLFVLMLTVVSVFAQAPQKMSYQAVVRNASNALVTNQNVSVRISVLQGSATGSAVYVETHNTTTNVNGLLTIEVGDGNAQTGNINQVNWGNGPYYLKSEIDPEGGINYSVTSVQQLLSVPYALYAQSAGNVPAFAITPTDTGYVLVLTMGNGTTQSYVLRNGQDGAPGAQGPAGPAGQNGQDGAPGANGQSAYELWQAAGNTGTVADFLASLVGPQGTPGVPGNPGADGTNGRGITSITGPVSNGLNDTYTINYTDGTTSTFVVANGAQGAQGPVGAPGAAGTNGQSAYELWQAAGNTGTVADFFASLVGPQGTPGAPGADGTNGRGITSITGPVTDGLNDTYTINYTDGTISSFVVKNGAQGPVGVGVPQTLSVAGNQLTISSGNTVTLPTAGGGDGLSAYQIWLNAGHTGSEADFLASLIGATGNGIASITGPVSAGNVDTYTLNFTDGSTYNFTVTNGLNGNDGNDGNGIASITGPVTSGNVDTYTINLTDGTHTTFTVTNGLNGVDGENGASAYQLWLDAGNTGTMADFFNALKGPQGETGKGIFSVTGPATAGNVDTYTITYTDGSNSTFTVTNGINGNDGNDGRGISSVTSTTSGLVDTYTIHYTDGTEYDFVVTNGAQGLPGNPGADGKGIANITKTATADNVDTYTILYTDNTTDVFYVTNGTNGVSPTVTCATATGGINITVTDANGPLTYFIPTINPDSIHQLPANWAETDPNNPQFIMNKPIIPVVPTNVSAFTNDAGYITASDVPAQQQADWNATDNTSAQFILNKPTIPTVPTNVSAFTNDAGYITASDVPAQVNADWNATSGAAQIMNKPTIPAVNNATLTIKQGSTVLGTFTANASDNTTINIAETFSGSYNDLTDKPTIPTVNDATLTIKQGITELGTFTANAGTNKTITIPAGFSGSYNDLTDKPTIPTVPTNVSAFTNDAGYITASDVPAQVNADWNATSGAAQILNKPTIPTVPTNVSDLTNDAGYITSADVPSNVSAFNNDAEYITVHDVPGQVRANWAETNTESPSYIENKPNLANVSYTGDYNDLSNTPDIPTSLSELNNDQNFVTNNEVGVYQRQANWSETDTESPTYIQNKPTLSAVATSGDYEDLNNLPQMFSGNYNDLTNKPEIPAAQVNANWAETDASSKAFIQNKPDMSNYVTVDQLNDVNGGNYVTLNGNEVVNGNKEFTGNNTFEGTVEVPSVLNNITEEGNFVLEGTNNCEQAVNFCDLNTLYQTLHNEMMQQMSDLNDQIEHLKDSIDQLNKEMQKPKDGSPCPNTPIVTDVDGNSYSTVRIGNQCWTRENLRTTHWPNGHAISQSALGIPSLGVTVAGYLYSFDDVMAQTNAQSTTTRTQGICPSGWHVPTRHEYEELTSYVRTKLGLTSSYVANSLAANLYWHATGSSSDGPREYTPGADLNNNNSTGFSMVPNDNNTDFPNEEGCLYTSDHYRWALSYNMSWPLCDVPWPNSIKYGVRCLRDNMAGEELTVHAPVVEIDSSAIDLTPTPFIGDLVAMTFGAVITDDGGATVTGCGFVFGDTPDVTYTPANYYPGSLGSNVTVPIHFLGYYLPSSSNTTVYARAYAVNQADTAYSEPFAFVTPGDGAPCSMVPSVTDIDGNTYNTVMIGTQCWLKENMRTTRYADHTPIPYTASHSNEFSTPYYTDNLEYGSVENAGFGYNWYAAVNQTVDDNAPSVAVRGVCPLGWHVPTRAEFQTFKDYVQATYGSTAKPIAATSGWSSSSTNNTPGNNQSTNNASGFSLYQNTSSYAELWYCTAEFGDMYVYYSLSNLSMATEGNKYFGVRCLKDDELSRGHLSEVEIINLTNANSSFKTKNITVEANYNYSTPNEIGFYCSTSHNPSATNYMFTGTLQNRTATDIIDRSEIQPNTTYYIRAYTTTTAGIYYSDEMSFTTTSFAMSCPDAPTVTDANGNVYPTVQLGSQCWMAQNLRSTVYPENNGNISQTAIPDRYVNNDYGLLYSFSAAMHGASSGTHIQGACPTGWHIPSAGEFNTMFNYMRTESAFSCDGNPDSFVKALVSATGWQSSDNPNCVAGSDMASNNAAGFNVFPAGVYLPGRGNEGYGMKSVFMTINPSKSYEFEYNDVGITSVETSSYQSLRCIKGATPPSVATLEDQSLSATSATVVGEVYTNGGSPITEKGICYSWVNHKPTTADSKVVHSNNDAVWFTAHLTNLLPNMTYYYCAYATNENGTQYGQVYSFTTGSVPQVSTSQNTTNFGETTITCYANVTNPDHALIDQYAFDVEIYQNGSWTPWNTFTVNDSEISDYNAALDPDETGLNPQTAYGIHIIYPAGAKCRAKAKIFSFGTWVEANNYVEWVGFHAPEVQTGDYEISEEGNYTFYGEVIDRGNPELTSKGFLVSRYETPTFSNSQVIHHGGRVNAFHTSPMAVSYGLTVYYCVFAISPTDTVYGEVRYVAPVTAPEVRTFDAYAAANYGECVSNNSIKMGVMSVNSHGAPIQEAGVVYSRTASTAPTLNNAANVRVQLSGDGVYAFANVTGLTANTIYYMRGYVRTFAGITYGEVKPVRTAINCGQTLTDQDNNTYSTAQYGSRCWMTAQLKATHYDNGLLGDNRVAIPHANTSTASDAQRYYYNPVDFAYLYNVRAVYGYGNPNYGDYDSYSPNMTTTLGYTQGICPRGWHIPTNAELDTLTLMDGTNSSNQHFLPLPFTGYIDANGVHQDPPGISYRLGFYWGGTYSQPYFLSANRWWNAQAEDRPDVYYYTTHSAANSATDNLTNHGSHSLGAWSNAYAFALRCVQDIVYPEKVIFMNIDNITPTRTSNTTAHCTSSLHEVVTPAHGTYEVGFVYSSSNDNPLIGGANCSVVGGTVENGRYINADLSGLQPGVVYYIRSYFKNSTTPYYSKKVDFVICPQNVTDYDGNTYNVARIGTQCWMKEDLKTTHYSNGTAITQSPLTGEGFHYSNSIKYCYPMAGMNVAYSQGTLYNFTALMHGETYNSNSNVKGVCPTGWHVPSNAEWSTLKNFVKSQPEYRCDDDEDNIAAALSDPTGWGPNTVNEAPCGPGASASTANLTGFSAINTGMVWNNSAEGVLYANYNNAHYWSSQQRDYNLYIGSPEFRDVSRGREVAMAVRCIYDGNAEEPYPQATDAQPCPNTPTVTDYDGVVYNTVMIGNQCWTKGNLRSTHYADGTPLEAGNAQTTNVQSKNNPYYFHANGGAQNDGFFGLLYNWKAVMGAAASSAANPSQIQGICPNGWHVPSDAEFTQLTDYIGTYSDYRCGRGSMSFAKALASTSEFWNDFDEDCSVGYLVSGNNATGFSAQPAGGWDSNSYYGYRQSAYFWTSTAYNNDTAYNRSVYYDKDYVDIFANPKYTAHSVRCLKD